MGGRSLFLVALVVGCARGPDKDLQYIKQARSLAAEWALVNKQSVEGKLTATYVHSMRRWLLGGLKNAHSSLARPEAAYADEIEALLAEAPGAAPRRLQAHAERLKQIEDDFESD